MWDAERVAVYPVGDKADSSRFKASDIDIFLYGLSREQAERKIEHILAVLGWAVKVERS